MESKLAYGLAVGAMAAALAAPAFAQDNSRRNSDINDPLLNPAAVVEGTDLPVTAVAEGSGEMTADPARPTAMDVTAQNDPPLDAPTGTASVGGSDVTVRNTRGIRGVHDSLGRDVYTGVEGAGGTDVTSAGPQGEAAIRD